jgi:hypothetical protein
MPAPNNVAKATSRRSPVTRLSMTAALVTPADRTTEA